MRKLSWIKEGLTVGAQGKSTVAAAWSESGLSWAEFLPLATEVLRNLFSNDV